jgi:hypothetical protein
MSKHTPGPWTLEVYEQTEEWEDERCVIIGEGKGQDEVFVRDEANARLIAAAPDLYEALDRALAGLAEVYQEWGRETGRKETAIKWLINDDPAVVAGLAALRKARGE